MKKEKPKCVLLYSGGLDTSAILKILQEKYGYDVVAVAFDVGQSDLNSKKVKQKAKKLGAKEVYVIDAKKIFADEFIAKSIKANGLYGENPLCTALSRYLMSKIAVEIANKTKATAIVHGCTGKGNDQVRFDVSIQALNPKLKIIAPVRELNLTREEEIKYALQHKISISKFHKKYSADENLWGKYSGGSELEKPEQEPAEDVFQLVSTPEKTPNNPEYINLHFEKGIPTKLNGKKMELWKLIVKLNKIGAKHGVGIKDHIEDKIIGFKSREICECPAATIILKAHKELEKFVSTIHMNQFKNILDQKWAELTYSGLFFDPLMTSLNAFMDEANKKVTGFVKLKLYKGNAMIVGRNSPYALYGKDMKYSVEKSDSFDQKDSIGFIKLFGLQTKAAKQVRS